MATTLEQIKTQGGLVDNTLVKKSDTWNHYEPDEDGEMVERNDDVEFFVRRASHVQFRKAMSGGDDNSDPESLLIAACIRLGEDGSEELTYDQVTSLESGLFRVFMNAVSEVYAPKVKSRQKKNSGANSSSTASEEEPSAKPRKTSQKTKQGSGKRTSSNAGA